MNDKTGRLGWRLILGLYLAGLLVSLLAASLETAPGYMDADYYYAGAQRLVNGYGASEPYLWNFLNDPIALPAPSFAYWMPMTSFVSAAGLWVFPQLGFWGARLGSILLAAFVPLLAALLTGRLTHSSAYARLAGLLALFPGFYLAYQTTTDAFPIYMVLGGLFFLVVLDGGTGTADRIPGPVRSLLLGILAGFFHLTRADGIVWLGGALLAVWLWLPAARSKGLARLFSCSMMVFLGYGLVMGPWFARNLSAWGSMLPPGGSRAVWITEYEQTMIYPAAQLSIDHWLAAGWGAHLQDRGYALGLNLQTALAVQGGIILLPFILAGMWTLRSVPAVRLGAFLWLLTAGLMTLIFPFAGGNGGFFHSGAALQPLMWAVVPTGVERLMLAYARWRRLHWPLRMVQFMSGLIVVVAVLSTMFLYFQRVVGSVPGGLAWSTSDSHYRLVEQTLVEFGAEESEPVLVNNPPGYWVASGRPAVVIPYGDERMLLDVARDYGVRYLVLEETNPWQLSDLYHRRIALPELEFLASIGSTQLYRIAPLNSGR